MSPEDKMKLEVIESRRRQSLMKSAKLIDKIAENEQAEFASLGYPASNLVSPVAGSFKRHINEEFHNQDSMEFEDNGIQHSSPALQVASVAFNTRMGSPKDADQRPNILEEFGDLSSELANYEEIPQGIVVSAHIGESKFVQFKEPVKSDGAEQIVEENEEE